MRRTPRKPAATITPALITEIKRLVARGLTQDNISVRLGCSQATVSRYRRDTNAARIHDLARVGEDLHGHHHGNMGG